MAVYVDPMMPCSPSRRWRWTKACHLFADTLAELWAFADRLGLKRSWFQAGSLIPHYDLTEGMRKLKGSYYQVVLRELQTLSGHPDRLHVWTRLAKEAAARHS